MPSMSAMKEYFVKLGFDVDEKGYQSAMNMLSSLGSKIKEKFTLTKSTAKLGTLLTSSLPVAVNTYLANMASNLADADKEAERFARRLWTTKENARALNNALDVMGKDYGDIFWMTPEEFNQFKDLKNMSAAIQPPKGLEDMLKIVRGIGHEVNKFKLTFQQARGWVAYYVGKMMGGDLEGIRKKFAAFNQWLIEKLPRITKIIANFFYFFYRIGKTAVDLIWSISNGLAKLFNGFDDGTKKVAISLAALFLMIKTSPIGPFIALLMALFILLDDFFTYQRGGKSYYAEQWEGLTKFFTGKDGEIDKSKVAILGVVGAVILLGSKLLGLKGKLGGLTMMKGLLTLISSELGIITAGIAAFQLAANKFFDWYVFDLLGVDLDKMGITKEEFFKNQQAGPVLPYGFAADTAEGNSFDAVMSSMKSNPAINTTLNQNNTINVNSADEVGPAVNGATSGILENRKNYSPML